MILASTPESTPGGAPDPDLVTPGTIGFLFTFAVVVGVIFLIRDALRRVRRVRARSGASDAYPIPLRRHVVPNQSTLSGPDEPKHASSGGESSETPAAGPGESSGTPAPVSGSDVDAPDDAEDGSANGSERPDERA